MRIIQDNTFKILQPRYYSKFQCDPIKCYETCCERWKIIIDKSTYQKYIQSENATIKEIVKTGLSINETSVNDDDFAIIHLNNEMGCPFLNQNNLCEIFIHMGESSLSKTCKSYPRAVILVNDVIERGLEMSCSIAAELILLNESGIEFELVMDAVKLNDIYIVSPTIEDSRQIEIIKEIRTTVINLLQTRTVELSGRVAIVGSFLNQIVGSIDFSNIHHEEALSKIKEAKSLINLREFKTTKNDHQLQDIRQFDYLNTILSMKFKEGDSISFFSKRYIECLMQVLDAFGRIKNKELEKHYKRNFEKYLKPYLDKKSYILENFLVNYVFIYGVELFKSNDIWTSYLKICVIYGLIKFNLVGLATYHKGMNDDLALKLIQSLSKTIITDKSYLESVIKYLEREKLVELTKVTTLITD
ncbi:lysine-N-methylase [Anaerosolibacter carboniphilus]|uniref:Lysine-N-methylase n=1 Tax=Anaerosolibacter carboniphilus TaxID=1417629 RepID=A0A841KTM7_9FIRM|nr:flagellin lysine-N-methylase [Anaerosolibacter carboniphilus]MBB6215380.1 lysine-N-methylase [Anaerosolibacter carboniphilus]